MEDCSNSQAAPPSFPPGGEGIIVGSHAQRKKRNLIARASDQEWSTPALLLLLDVLAWLSTYSLVSLLRGGVYSSPLIFLVVDLVQLGFIVMTLYTVGGYDRNTETRSLVYATEHLFAIGSAALISAAVVYSAAAFDQFIRPSRSVFLGSFLVFLPISLEYRRWIRRRIAQTITNRYYLVIGSGERARQFFESYKDSPNRQQLHFVTLNPAETGQYLNGPESPVLQGNLIGRLVAFDRLYSGIILTERVEALGQELLDRLVRTQFQRTRVYTLEAFYESHWRYVPLDAVDAVWPLQTGFQLARNTPYHYLKRLCDTLAAVAGMVLFAPVFALAALLVWLESGPPVFYCQPRIGRGGRQFTLYKLRTMLRAKENKSEELYTQEDDPRVLRTGRWLRRLRLDELPQLWNVLRGDMSLIGPRAEWVKCAERYEKHIPCYHFRHLVKPGITGWAQVNYPYGASDQDAIEKLKYDLYYIRHYSLTLDAMIALKTIHVMLFGRGR